MITKIESRVVRQPDARVRRSWYQSPMADLVLMHDAGTGDFLSFEIEWEQMRGAGRSYVLWSRGVGLRTGSIDTGDGRGALSYKPSPVVTWDFRERPDLIREARSLLERSCVEEGLRESVLRRLAL